MTPPLCIHSAGRHHLLEVSEVPLRRMLTPFHRVLASFHTTWNRTRATRGSFQAGPGRIYQTYSDALRQPICNTTIRFEGGSATMTIPSNTSGLYGVSNPAYVPSGTATLLAGTGRLSPAIATTVPGAYCLES